VIVGAEAVITVPCPLAIGTMDCITDSACRTCCINNGYTDGECNGFLWACVCTKGRSQQPEKKACFIREAAIIAAGMARNGNVQLMMSDMGLVKQ